VSSQLLRRVLPFVAIGAFSILAPRIANAQPAEREMVDAIRRILDTGNLDRQKAVLTLIPEAGLKGMNADATRTTLEEYLRKTTNEECKVLALNAFGKLNPPSASAAKVIKAYLTGQAPPVRRAAAGALERALSASSTEFAKPGISIVANVESVNAAAGSAVALAWIREWTSQLLEGKTPDVLANESAEKFIRFGESSKQLLPLCAASLNDGDELVRASGAEGIRLVGASITDVLPDPATAGSETRTIDPFEAKLKWLLLQPAFKALNEAAPPLVNGIQSKRMETRLASVRAAEALASAHALALASRRSPPDNMQAFVANVPPEDPLRSGGVQLASAMAAALEDESPAIRLTAAEAFESLGPDGRTQLPTIIRASRNEDLFVRWASTRTLGVMFAGATAEQGRQIADALSPRVEDSDLDVATVAMYALAKGSAMARPATEALLRRSAKGDPDTCILAIRTLDMVNADPAVAVAGLIPVLSSDSERVRRAAVIYLGKRGKAALSAIPQLRRLLFDSDEDVRKETAKAILLIEKEL
jgi:HEAT repeat protein